MYMYTDQNGADKLYQFKRTKGKKNFKHLKGWGQLSNPRTYRLAGHLELTGKANKHTHELVAYVCQCHPMQLLVYVCGLIYCTIITLKIIDIIPMQHCERNIYRQDKPAGSASYIKLNLSI